MDHPASPVPALDRQRRAGICVIVSHARQLIRGRTWTTTLKCEGTYSSTSRSSSPSRLRRALPQAGHTQAASCTTRSRGRWAGSGWRPRRRGASVFEEHRSGAVIAALKLEILRLRRELYGQKSERKARLLDQLELQLEELEATATEDELRAEQAAARASTRVRTFTRRHRFVSRSLSICRASGW
jgi:hypothetical protein